MAGNIYPMKFYPILEQPVWKGKTLNQFRRIDDSKDYGIAWEVSAHPNATNIVKNGKYKGKTLNKVLENNPKSILGNKVNNSDVLRVSYIDAGDNLSIQVHPHVKELEQNEIWYILKALENAEVILGVNVKNKESLEKAIENNETESILGRVPVEEGDFIYIPGGLVHALTGGVTVLEVGQNHDNTYRLFDYNRGREIHVEESLECTRFDVEPIFSKVKEYTGAEVEKMVAYEGEDFTIELIQGKGDYLFSSDENRYYVYTNLGEDCEFVYEDEVEVFEKGESILIPATLGNYSIKGKLKLFKSYIS